MASAKQGITIWGPKSGEWPDDSDLLILVKKTGYYNFSINGKQYYCDERIDTTTITNSLLVFAFNGGKSGKKKKKGQITISKK